MSDVPSELSYTKSHEWVHLEDGGVVTVGITDYAQEALGDLVFVELPGVGDAVDPDEACAVVESVKSASDVYAPFPAEVVSVNEKLEEEPETINDDPYGEGWLMKLRIEDESVLDDLLDADNYEQFLDNEAG